MSLPLDFRPEAQDDLLEARSWYENQRAGLRDEFADAVDEFFAQVAEMPELYAIALRDVRRGKMRRFPYVAYYRVLADRIEVTAVLHGSRNPQVWQDRV